MIRRTQTSWCWLPAALLIGLLSVASGKAEVKRTTGLLAGNTPWENPYYIVDSGIPGPTLLISGGLHGNEPAGWRAAEQIRHWPLTRGKLIVVPRANSPGLKQNTRWLPGLPESTRNANRNFPKTGGPNRAKTVPVVALWEFIQQHHPDWVVDLHEGFDFHVAHPKSDGSSIIYFDTPEMQRIATQIHDRVNATIDDPRRKIVKLCKSGPIDGGLVRAAVEQLAAKGFCFETTYQHQPLSTRTRQHRIMVHCLMRRLDMAAGNANVMTPRAGSTAVQVAVYDAGGTGGKGVKNLQRILESGAEFAINHIGPDDIRTGGLEPFDVVIFPGGSGSKQARAIGTHGRRAVQEFVRQGGGYVGICAGAFLATARYDWSLALLDAKTFTGKRDVPGEGMKSMWFRGKGTVEMELTDEGRTILGPFPDRLEVHYANGPILSPAAREDLGEYAAWAVFRTEISKYEPQKGTMTDTPAIVVGKFGKGRAVAISPHPEATEGLEGLVRRAVAWAAGKDE